MTLQDRREFAERCERCNSCRWVPAATSARHASTCPSVDYGKFHSYGGAGKSMIAYALAEGRQVTATEELTRSIFACSACGACDTACKWNHQDLVDPLDTIYALRQKMVEDGKAPDVHSQAMQSVRAHGNRFGKAASERFAWAKGIELPDARSQRCETLLHIGCENAFDDALHEELRAAVRLLRAGSVSFGVLYDDEVDCGGYAFDIGQQKEAARSAQALANAIKATGAKSLVTCSAASFSSIRNIWPRLGVSLEGFEVQHFSQCADDLRNGGLLSKGLSARSGAVAYHDGCKLGRLSEAYTAWSGKRVKHNQVEHFDPPRKVLFGNDGVYDPPRRLIAATGADLAEMPRSRQFAYCCGALGGGKEAYPDFARHAAVEVLQEAIDSGAQTLVSGCGACTAHLRAIAEQENLGISVEGLASFISEGTEGQAEVRK